MPTAQSNVLTDTYARSQQAIAVDVSQRMTQLWQAVDPTDIDRSWPLVSRAATQVIAEGYAMSTASTAAYLTQHAALNGVALGQPLIAPPVNLAQLEVALRVTGPVALKRAAALGKTPRQAAESALVQLSGSAGRLALAGGRSTTLRTAKGADPVLGYRRVHAANCCAFCAMLASRGAVYKSVASAGESSGKRRSLREAGTAYHDHCHCQVEMLYAHEAEPAEVAELYARYLDATDGLSGKAALAKWRQVYDGERRGVLTGPVSIASRDLTLIGDDALASLLTEAAGSGDDAGMEKVLAELDRCDEVARVERVAAEAAAKRLAAREAKKQAEYEANSAAYERLVAEGMDPEEAYADAFGVDVERQRRDTAMTMLRDQGYQGANFDSLSRAAFREEAERLYFAAEDDTRGHMLNKLALNSGISERSLFTGPESRARKYASDELLQFWQDHGRLTIEDFQAGLLGGKMRSASTAYFA